MGGAQVHARLDGEDVAVVLDHPRRRLVELEVLAQRGGVLALPAHRLGEEHRRRRALRHRTTRRRLGGVGGVGAAGRRAALCEQRHEDGRREEAERQRLVQRRPPLGGKRRHRPPVGQLGALARTPQRVGAQVRVRERPQVRVDADGQVDRRLLLLRLRLPRLPLLPTGGGGGVDHRVGGVREAGGDVEELPRLHHRVDQQRAVVGRHLVLALAARKRVVRRRLGGRGRRVHPPPLAAGRLHQEDVLLVRVQLRRARQPLAAQVDVGPDGQLRRLEHRERHLRERRHDEAGVEHHHRRLLHGLGDVRVREARVHRLVVDAVAPLHAVRHELRRQLRDVALHVAHRVRADREAALGVQLEGPPRPAVRQEGLVGHELAEGVLPRRHRERARRHRLREVERRQRRRRRVDALEERDFRPGGGGGGGGCGGGRGRRHGLAGRDHVQAWVPYRGRTERERC